MKRILVMAALAVAALLLMASTASAASPHFKKNGEPVCLISQSGATSSTTCSGALTGLGGDDLEIDVTVSGFAVYHCQNPSGANEPPGQNRVLVGPVTAPTTIPGSEIKNGNLSFTTDPAALTAPSTVSGTAAGCNNNKWTGVNPTLTVTDIELVIEQPVGTPIFTCTASDPDGLSGSVALTC